MAKVNLSINNNTRIQFEVSEIIEDISVFLNRSVINSRQILLLNTLNVLKQNRTVDKFRQLKAANAYVGTCSAIG